MTLRAALHAAALVAFWVLFAYLFSLGTGYPWDFETYYYAAAAARHGLDPYHAENLVALAGRPVGMPFVYPPATLLLFAPFTWLPVHTADAVWLGVKTILLVFLLRLWLKRFLPRTDAILLSIVAAMGFNTAVLWDLKVGNVAVPEAFLLWTGFACYLQDRRTAFTVLVTLASVFKIVPIAFLALLLLPSKREPARPRLLLGGLVALAAIVLAPVLLGPAWSGGYFRHLPAERPTGIVNPCALGVIDTLLGTGGTEPRGPAFLPILLWAAFGAALAGVSWRAVKRAWAARDPLTWVIISVFLFELVSPRPMIYGYLMLIPPVMSLAPPLLKRVGGPFATAAILIAPAVARRLGVITRSFAADNSPFFLALGIWLLYVLLSGRRAGGPRLTSPTGGARRRTRAIAR